MPPPLCHPRPLPPPRPISMEDNRDRRDPSSMSDPLLNLLKIPAPIHRDEDLVRPPSSILLDPFGYISARGNHTTAQGFLGNEKPVKVTFWPACPPRVSCFTVHIPSLSLGSYADLPKILATDDDLVLLRVSVRSRYYGRETTHEELFVYQAGTESKPPELHRIPMPTDNEFSDLEHVLLRCRDRDMYYIVMLRRQTSCRPQFVVQVFNSKESNWRTMVVNAPKEAYYYCCSKAITIGGKLGSLGWVDLWHGILIYDVFQGTNQLRYIALPPPVVPRPLKGAPMVIRDIIVVGGCIKFFDMQAYMKPADVNDEYDNVYIPHGWEAVTHKMDLSMLDSKWEDDCEISIDGVPLDDLVMNTPVELLERKLTLMNLHAIYPALSLHDDGVVYIMNKHQHHDFKAWMIAVDMRHGAIKASAYFGSGRPLGYDFTYLQSEISKHLGKKPSTRHGLVAAATGRGTMVQSCMQNVEGTSCSGRWNGSKNSYLQALMGHGV